MKMATVNIPNMMSFVFTLLFFLSLTVRGEVVKNSEKHAMVVSTWPFREAVRAAWRAADDGLTAVDAVVEGCSACEELRCDGTVDCGNFCYENEETTIDENEETTIDENGETTIDALVMNGVTMEVGAVAAMRYVKDGIRAARLVMQHTEHALLVREKASAFAISMGLSGPTNLSSVESIDKWHKWKENSCQPNFWKNFMPVNNCGPYHPNNNMGLKAEVCSKDNVIEIFKTRPSAFGHHNHDTISMTVFDRMGHVAVGTSTNGATFKIPGRVGDGPIAGSSAYANDKVVACGTTGNGDIMMRFLPW